MNKQYYVYIMTNKKNGTLYIGVTSNLIKRLWDHKNKTTKGFTSKYNLTRLVYYEIHESIENAIKREKRLKLWLRQWKISLIEKENPKWEDLYDTLHGSFGQAEG
jgi:putative endonuclease